MAQCLHPIWIKIDRRKSDRLPYTDFRFTRYKDIRPELMDYVPVPCGKCINCLRNKQNAMVSRCLAESEKRGTFSFVTLTYNNDTLPVAQSLWRVCKDSGEVELVHKGEVLEDFTDVQKIRRELLIQMQSSEMPRYLDSVIDGFDDGEYTYFSRLTPTLNRKDFRYWIKRTRVAYEREFGQKLDFAYVCVGEMGPRTCRPHYHLALFGLTKEQVQYFVDRWKLGYTCVKHVNAFNPDGTDGFAIASRYIGKYMSKGKFDCDSVKDGSAVRPRVCQSLGIGRSLIDYVKNTVYCYDMFGQYDIDTLYCPSLNRCLNDNEIAQIVREVPKRLVYETSYGFKLPIPRLFRDDLFYHKTVKYERKRKFKDGKWVPCRTSKVLRVPTTLWSLVASDLREHLSNDNCEKFRKFVSNYSMGQISVACDAFEEYEASCVQISERSRETNYKNFLCSSKDGQ